MEIRVLLIGDIVGKPGRTVLKEKLPALVAERRIDFVIANGENAAQGSGITENLFKEIVNTGVGCVTCGDHVWKRHEILGVLERDRRLLRPLNYPRESTGRARSRPQASTATAGTRWPRTTSASRPASICCSSAVPT